MGTGDDMAWTDHLEAGKQAQKKRNPIWVLWAVFYLVLMLGLLIYSVYPVLIHSFIKVAPAHEYREVDTSGMPIHVSEYFDLTDSEFEEIGFVPLLTVKESGSIPGIETYLRAYENREDDVMGIALALAGGQAGPTSLHSTHVEFSTYFKDGREISSSSWDDVYPFRSTPERQFASLPELDDPRELYPIHSWRVDQAPEGERKFYEPGQGLEHLHWAIQAEMEAEERTGYLELDPKSGFYTLTWKGAYTAGLKQLWPFEGFIESARDREAKRLLQAAGAESHP